MLNFFKNLFKSNSSSVDFSNEELEAAGVCPNCWGHQEYDKAYQDFVKDQTKANINNNKANKKAFVQQFVETNITGIRLKKEGDTLVCPTCKTKYKQVSSKAN